MYLLHKSLCTFLKIQQQYPAQNKNARIAVYTLKLQKQKYLHYWVNTNVYEYHCHFYFVLIPFSY